MRIVVVGAGAVGGWFGAALSRAGVDVSFLVRGPRARRLREEGLVLVDPSGERTVLRVRAVTVVELTDPVDVVLLAVKGAALPAAMEDMARAVGPETAVLPLLNGIGHLDALTERFGPGVVLGGLCLIATTLDADGAVRLLNPGASLQFGELDGRVSTRVVDIATAFDAADFESTDSSTIVHDMWEKWHFMATGGATGTLLGDAAGRVTAVEGGREVVSTIIAEASAVLAAAGRPVRDEARARVEGALLTPSSGFTTSLYRDLAAGRRTEVEPILGDLVRRAEALGVPVPTLGAAAVRLRVHENRVHENTAG